MLTESNRETLSDKKIENQLINEKFINTLFTRLVAKNAEIKNIDFRYCIFDTAYLRNCKFEDCDFTGCKFISSNLSGSSFSGCKFDYATFEKTFIDDDILDVGCPGPENLKLKFARSLRTNYQQIGDAKAVNKAINIELQATEDHFRKAWSSKESYYRRKYRGLSRFKVSLEWLQFKTLDLIWGNGESTWKLFRAVAVLLIFIATFHTLEVGHPDSLTSYIESLMLSPQLLLGTLKPSEYDPAYLTLLYIIRLIMFGFFMSVIIKRFNRR